jgi:recombination protein RecA
VAGWGVDTTVWRFWPVSLDNQCPSGAVDLAELLAHNEIADIMFSTMTTSQTLLDRLPAELLQRAKSAGVAFGAQAREEGFLPFGFGPIPPEQGLLRGQVTELCVGRSGGLGTSLALSACAEAQQGGKGFGSDAVHWCAFVDPSGSLYAPGVLERGVELDRLLVVRPPVEALGRVALRLARSKVFVLLVVDTVGVPGQSLGVDLGAWVRIVRQMSLALEGSAASILLITSETARRPVALPVARRIDLSRTQPDVLRMRIARDRFRQPEPWRSLTHAVTRFDEPIQRTG